MSDLQQMNIEDLKQWYQSYYAPNNATLVVVGDVNPQHVYKLARHYFASIPNKIVPPRKSQQEPPALGKKSITIHGHAQLPLLLLGYTVPSVKTAKKSWEPYALEIIAGILDAGDGARFTKNLIKGSYIASGVDTYYNIYARNQTQFIVYGSPSATHTVLDLEKSILDELDRLKTQRVDAKELQRVKNQIIAQKTFEKDSIFGQAMELGLLETTGIGWRHVDDYNKSINSITPEQIQEAAKNYFQQNYMTEAELKPILQNEVKP
jgi:zinc protease